jgi:hypothetical protein
MDWRAHPGRKIAIECTRSLGLIFPMLGLPARSRAWPPGQAHLIPVGIFLKDDFDQVGDLSLAPFAAVRFEVLADTSYKRFLIPRPAYILSTNRR